MLKIETAAYIITADFFALAKQTRTNRESMDDGLETTHQVVHCA